MSDEIGAAQTLARDILIYLLSEPDRAARFLAASGSDGGDLRRRVDDPEFLGGVLDFVMDNEALLLDVAALMNCRPTAISAARRRLPGAPAEA